MFKQSQTIFFFLIGASTFPVDENARNTTIVEESSGHTWVDFSDTRSIQEHVVKREQEINMETDRLLYTQTGEYGHPQNSNARHMESSLLIDDVKNKYLPHQHLLTDTLCNDDFGNILGNENSSLDFITNLSAHSTVGHTTNKNSSIIDYAELRFGTTVSEQNYKCNTTDGVACRNPVHIGLPTHQGINSLKKDIIEAGPKSTSSGVTEYAEIMNTNYVRHPNTPPAPIYLVSGNCKTTTPSDPSITSFPFNKTNSCSDYILMSPTSPLAIPPTSFSFDVLPVTASSKNNGNSNSSSFVSKSYSGSNVSSSHANLEPSPSIGGFSVAGRSISTPERERRRLSTIRISSISF